MIREDNSILNKTFVFEYDNGGNIVSKKEYPYTLNELPQNATTTTLFTYDSTYKDKLVKVNDDIIEYGTTNNSLLPLSYKGATFTWNYNNRLTSYKKNANSNLVTYLYNTLGKRVQKSYNESSNIRAVHEYIYDGNTLIKETITRHVMRPDDLTPIPDSMLTPSIIQYLYDDNTIIGFVYNDTPYYYIKDALGNIKYVLDGTYNIVAKYEYDAWGNHVVYKKTTSGYTINQDAGFIGNVNPIRYKGYYYDGETQLFYCNSRYYSPELCRFISPDDIEYLDPESVNGLNLYCYCKNNPIMYADPSGHFTIAALLISIGISLAFEVVEDLIGDGKLGGDKDGWDYLGALIAGFFGGLGGSLAVQAIFSVVGALADAAISGDLVENGFWSTMGSIALSTVISFGAGALSRKFSNNIQIKKLNTNPFNNRNVVRNLRVNYSFTKNGKSVEAAEKAIKNGNWISKTLWEGFSSNLGGSTTSFVWGLIF